MTVGDQTPQVRQGVPFDGPLALAKLGPEKPAQAPVAGCRVEGRDRRLQLQTELLVGLQASGFHHELLRPVGVDAPVSAFVSLGQRAAGHLRPKPQGIEPLASGAQAGLDLAQAFPGRQRREGQGQKLAAAREAAPPAVFCSGSTRRWNGSRSRPSVRWAKTVDLSAVRLTAFGPPLPGGPPRQVPHQPNTRYPEKFPANGKLQKERYTTFGETLFLGGFQLCRGFLF